MNEILDMGAVELGRAMRSGQMSPVEVVDAHIQQIEAVNPHLNAVVVDRFDAARDEARVAEDRLVKASDDDELSPLYAVPCTIKEFLALTEFPQTGGMMSRQGVRPDQNATVVSRLRDAGAIIMGCTNVPEGGLWMETINPVYGRTENPRRRGHTPGGSSGGEGSIIACGGSPFGLGSDVGGSVRIPAAFCGTAGHKPSGRLVPNTGHFPAADDDICPFLVIGPLARRVEDLEAVLGVIAGPDGVDPVCHPMAWHDTSVPDMKDVVVFPIESNGRTWVRDPMRQAIRDCTQALVERGARVDERKFDRLKRGFMMWAAMMSEAAEHHYDVVLGDGTAISLWSEVAKLPIGRSRHSFQALALALVDKLASRFGGQISRLVEDCHALQRELEEALGPNGVILHPPYTRPAPRHHYAWLTPIDPVCTAIFNVLEFPSTVVPVALSDQQLPISVQVVGSRGHDGLTLSVARALEADFQGWRRAPFGAEGWDAG